MRQTLQRKRKQATTFIFMIGGGIAVIIILGLVGSLLSTCNPARQSQPTLSTLLPILPSHTPTFTPTHTTTSTSTLTVTVSTTMFSLTATGTVSNLSTPSPMVGLDLSLSGKIILTCTPELYNQLCLMNADGSGYTRITNHMANDYYPSLTHNGQEILFVSNRSTLFEVYIIALDGSNLRQLTQQIGNVTAPELSPDGNQVVFALKRDGDSSIWLVNKDGGNPHPITDEQWNEIDPTWSPDGQRIAFASMRGGYVELFTMRPDGSDIRQVTGGLYGIGGRNSWSPDGKNLVFYAGPQNDRDIYLVEISTGIITRLTHGGNNTGPCFSPDGEWITFSSSRDGDHEIFIMRPDGTQVTQLTWNAYDDWQPRWGP